MSVQVTCELDNHFKDGNYNSLPEPHQDYNSLEKSELFTVSHFQTSSTLQVGNQSTGEPQDGNLPVHANPWTTDVPVSTGINRPTAIKPKNFIGSHKESKERQALHKELLMNYKMRNDVLQNSELNKVLRERREKERKRECGVLSSVNRRPSLEIKLEERANKIKADEDRTLSPASEKIQTHELTRVHRMITLKSSQSNE